MKTMITIRKAVREDCPRLLELIHELAAYEKAPEQVSVDINHFTQSGFGENPVWWGFVAIEEDLIVGFGLYYIRYSTWKGQAMYLEDLLVTASRRGQGIGTLLFNRLLEEAIEKKLPRMVWQVLEWNEPAIAFYQKYHAVLDREWINASVEVQPSAS